MASTVDNPLNNHAWVATDRSSLTKFSLLIGTHDSGKKILYICTYDSRSIRTVRVAPRNRSFPGPPEMPGYSYMQNALRRSQIFQITAFGIRHSVRLGPST